LPSKGDLGEYQQQVYYGEKTTTYSIVGGPQYEGDPTTPRACVPGVASQAGLCGHALGREKGRAADDRVRPHAQRSRVPRQLLLAGEKVSGGRVEQQGALVGQPAESAGEGERLSGAARWATENM
ncbi:hypothetical protein, partial [Streptomyces sp. NPDC003435]